MQQWSAAVSPQWADGVYQFNNDAARLMLCSQCHVNDPILRYENLYDKFYSLNIQMNYKNVYRFICYFSWIKFTLCLNSIKPMLLFSSIYRDFLKIISQYCK